MVHWLSSPIFPCSVVRPAMVTSSPPPLLLAPDPKPIHFLKAYDKSYSKMNSEHKYKDKDKYKDNDKDKDATRITVLFFRNPYDSSISRIMVDTSS